MGRAVRRNAGLILSDFRVASSGIRAQSDARIAFGFGLNLIFGVHMVDSRVPAFGLNGPVGFNGIVFDLVRRKEENRIKRSGDKRQRDTRNRAPMAAFLFLKIGLWCTHGRSFLS